MAETLESLIDNATDPVKSGNGVDYSTLVCDRINLDLDGPQVGIRYMATKVKSAKEEEAILGLNLIEACVQNCGQRFHAEVGKYRFLNELIKLISSKYDGDWTPDAVKRRIIQMMYSWTIGLPKETKISEAYKMLKQQGIVTKDPDDPYAQPTNPPPERHKDTIFEDEEKSKLLARLLKSSHPEDLQAANRLIKTMVRQDEIKMERQVKRNTEMETCCNNIKLLTEMLNHYSPSSPSQDKELMKELYDACDRMRPQLFRLASSATEDGDEGLAEILRVNDDLSRVLEYYRKIFGLAPLESPGTGPLPPPATQNTAQEASAGSASTLIDLGVGQAAESAAEAPVSSVLENELKALGLHDLEAQPPTSNAQIPIQQGAPQPGSVGPWGVPAQSFGMFPPNMSSTVGVVRPMGQYQAPGMGPPGFMAAGQVARMPFQPMGVGLMSMSPRPGPVSMGTSSLTMATTGLGGRGTLSTAGNRRGAEETKSPNPLDLLGQEMLQTQKQQQKQKQTVTPLQEKAASEQQQATTTDSLLSLGLEPSPAPQPAVSVSSTSPASFTPIAPPPKPTVPLSLDNVFVPLDTITPGNHPPLTVLDKNSIRIIFHFAKTSAELHRNDLLIVVISTMSSLSTAVKNFIFQAAVPKTMRVKLQPPSGSELPAHNPILPPSAITQVMLIANPAKEKIRLKYKVSYQVDGTPATEIGEVDSFPNVQE